MNQAQLKELLHYDPETGVLTWLKSFKGPVKKGMIAGGINPSDGYRYVRIQGVLRAAHIWIWLYMTGEFPLEEVDHENRERDDNRWTNLREATSRQQKQNTSLRSDNTSGYKGVSLCQGMWKAQINIPFCGVKYLGRYSTKEEAAEVYAKAAAEHYGEFANPVCAV